MKKIYGLLLLLVVSFKLFSQEEFDCSVFEDQANTQTTEMSKIVTLNSNIYKSSDGVYFPTQGTFRALTIFVNIIYDQTPTMDPCFNSSSAVWSSSLNNVINENPPSYMLNLFDKEIMPTSIGVVTRLYAESSFNQLMILSDFIIVNINQSQITPNNSGESFSIGVLVNKVISYINNNGFQTYYGHNNAAEYDKFTPTIAGLPKTLQSDAKIDLACFLLRNTTNTYGGVKNGSGVTYYGYNSTEKLIINGQQYDFNALTYQCVGTGDITTSKKGILTHEFAHLFLGSNEFHTSGGTTNNDSYYNSFINKQYGYGLFNGGLLSCNGYERWRLGWHHSANNAYSIASNNVSSDIEKFTGERVFTLRDFITYGDAIRIKMPYKDTNEASNQYIWLENHQTGKNEKLDGHIYMDRSPCRTDQGGIFAYYQVGKDIIESSTKNDIYPVSDKTEKDNLKIISAEGNYNMKYTTKVEDCLGWSGGNNRPQFEYLSQNTLNGVNDESGPISYSTSLTTLRYPEDYQFMGSKIKEGVTYNDLPWLGDKFDAFIPTISGKVMDISTNPSPTNTITYYCTKYGTMNVISTSRNTRKIYLTGLSIKMIDPDPSNTEMKAYTVKVRWDDYDIKQDVNWSGDIVLKEQLNLLQGKILSLEQNKTPNQIDKDPVSNYFAKTTFLTCESNSSFNIATNSVVLVKEKSSLVLNNNSTLTVQSGGIITIESGSTLQIKTGANLNLLGSAKIVIKSGGYICVESGANINLQDYTSLIVLEEGAIYGANPALFSSPSCSSTITKTGNGTIVDYNQDVYIQNETISTNRYIGGKYIFVGNHVTTIKSFGDVSINNGINVIFDCKEITFDAGFECDTGSTYEVRNH